MSRNASRMRTWNMWENEEVSLLDIPPIVGKADCAIHIQGWYSTNTVMMPSGQNIQCDQMLSVELLRMCFSINNAGSKRVDKKRGLLLFHISRTSSTGKSD